MRQRERESVLKHRSGMERQGQRGTDKSENEVQRQIEWSWKDKQKGRVRERYKVGERNEMYRKKGNAREKYRGNGRQKGKERDKKARARVRKSEERNVAFNGK